MRNLKSGIESPRILIPVNFLRDHSRIRVYLFGTLEKIRLSQAFLHFHNKPAQRSTEEDSSEGRLHRVTVISTQNRKIILSPWASSSVWEQRNVPTWKNDNKKKGDKESDRDIWKLYVSPSTMGKIFSLMNQDEYTPVPITLQPRSPYFALLDFCHFKANEMSERQGRNRRKREIENDDAVRGVSSVSTHDRC